MRFETVGAGNGDKMRPVDKEKFNKNWERIFMAKKKKKKKKAMGY